MAPRRSTRLSGRKTFDTTVDSFRLGYEFGGDTEKVDEGELQGKVKELQDEEVAEAPKANLVDIEKSRSVLHSIQAASQHCVVPEHFSEIWEGIVEMRKDRNAPVDSQGCDALGKTTEDPKLRVRRDRKNIFKRFRFHYLVACLLSSQTSDASNAACMERLKRFGLTMENIIAAPIEQLRDILRGVSFHNTKAKHLKMICRRLLTERGGDIPDTFESLIELPGLGPKMALLCLSYAWGRTEGIAVDVHVHRVTNRLGLVQTKSPNETCVALAGAVPRALWRDFNEVIVGFGQQHCKAINPLCGSCLVAHLCPSAFLYVKRPKEKAIIARKRGRFEVPAHDPPEPLATDFGAAEAEGDYSEVAMGAVVPVASASAEVPAGTDVEDSR